MPELRNGRPSDFNYQAVTSECDECGPVANLQPVCIDDWVDMLCPFCANKTKDDIEEFDG